MQVGPILRFQADMSLGQCGPTRHSICHGLAIGPFPQRALGVVTIVDTIGFPGTKPHLSTFSLEFQPQRGSVSPGSLLMISQTEEEADSKVESEHQDSTHN